MSYCTAVNTMPAARQALHQAYHDHHYGFSIHDGNELFDLLIAARR